MKTSAIRTFLLLSTFAAFVQTTGQAMRLLCAVLALWVVAFTPVQAQNQPAELVGTWKFVSQTLTEVQSGKVSKYYGEKPRGYIWYSKGGNVIFVLFNESRPKPATPFKDEDKARLFDSMTAGSGTYKTEGNKLVISYDTSWHELWAGTTQTRTFEIKDKKLTITSDPNKNAAGVDVIFKLELEKIE